MRWAAFFCLWGYGQFLSSPDKDAYWAVNSKRVDFALVDPDACVKHAIKYQNSGRAAGAGGEVGAGGVGSNYSVPGILEDGRRQAILMRS